MGKECNYPRHNPSGVALVPGMTFNWKCARCGVVTVMVGEDKEQEENPIPAPQASPPEAGPDPAPSPPARRASPAPQP